MGGKISIKLRQPVANKSSKPVIVSRQQVLPTEILLDIFNASQRVDLDKWSVVSRQYVRAIRRAKPLRTVKGVSLFYENRKKVYTTHLRHEDEEKVWRGKIDSRSRAADQLAFFIKAIRFCYVDGALYLQSVSINREFAKSLQSVNGDFLFEDSFLYLGSYDTYSEYTPEAAADRLDALCSFPSLRTLNESTFRFLCRWGDPVDDGFLKSLASQGIFEVGDVQGRPDSVDNGIPGKDVTEHGIIDYCFGAYDDGGKERRLHVTDPQLTSQFISKLVEACRASKSNHKLTLNVVFTQLEDDEELFANWTEASDSDGHKQELCVDDLSLRIRYYKSDHPKTRYLHGLIIVQRG